MSKNSTAALVVLVVIPVVALFFSPDSVPGYYFGVTVATAAFVALQD